MTRMTRRAVLAAFSAGGLGALVSATEAAPAEEPAARQDLFVMGPFSLGDWFKKYRESVKAQDGIAYGAPDDAEIVKSFNECKLYVIDRRVWKDKDAVGFDDSKKWAPQFAASGKLIHSWKEKGKNCTIWLTKFEAFVDTTDSRVTLPFRKVLLHVTMDIRGDNGIVVETATYGFSSHLSYDVTGKQLPGEE